MREAEIVESLEISREEREGGEGIFELSFSSRPSRDT